MGLGTLSWVSVRMTPLSCGFVGLALGAETWLTCSSCGSSLSAFKTFDPVKQCPNGKLLAFYTSIISINYY